MLTSLQQYQQRLVEDIQKMCALSSEHTLQAFLKVPRHPFVHHYYLQQPGTSNWIRYEQKDSPEWYEQVYSNQALVTLVDQHGRTLSSSSQPGIMAMMLDALELQPGMQVLEIGTGTGYNAALIASLVGDPHFVTTIDIEPEIVDSARQAIIEVVGEGMTIVQGDGTRGYSAHAPYDRILVTASSPFIPSAWMNQLAPDGLLVCVFQPGYARLGGLLKAQKTDGVLKGNIISNVTFMVLRDGISKKRSIRTDFRAPLYTSFPLDAALFSLQLLHENYDFAFYLYSDLPDLHIFQKGDRLFFSSEASPQGYIIFHPSSDSHYEVELRGDRISACTLWNRLIRVYSLWLHCGQPAITQYQFEMDENSQSLALATPSGRFWLFISSANVA